MYKMIIWYNLGNQFLTYFGGMNNNFYLRQENFNQLFIIFLD